MFFVAGCKEVKLVGDKFAKIYPNDGYADVAEVLEQKPVKITEPEEIPMSDLQGFICVSEKQFAKYRRAYESSQESASVLQAVQNKLNENRVKVSE